MAICDDNPLPYATPEQADKIAAHAQADSRLVHLVNCSISLAAAAIATSPNRSTAILGVVVAACQEKALAEIEQVYQC